MITIPFPLHVKVAEEIREGIKNDCGRCPISLAIQKLVPAIYKVNVHHNLLVIALSFTEELRIKLPADAINFIQRFDDDQQVLPIEFMLYESDIMIPQAEIA